MVKCFIACSGLGHVNRGFESFSRECFNALRSSAGLDLWLFKGAGESVEHDVTLPTITRDSEVAAWLERYTGRGRYYIEQFSFSLGLLSAVLEHEPHVIFFSDGVVGNVLWHWRKRTGARYKLLFSNGAPFLPPFLRWDHVHQVTAEHFRQALEAGQSAESMTFLPYGIEMAAEFVPLQPSARRDLRARLGLPVHRPLILSVGALNATHKRMDYLIREIANFPSPRPLLVMLGQREAETDSIISLARQRLGDDGFIAKSVPAHAVRSYYQVADVFVLASVREGFGRVFVEAMAAGLPCIAHDYAVAREVLGTCGTYADFSQEGALAAALGEVLIRADTPDARRQRHAAAYRRFSWKALAPAYVQMIRQCVGAEQ